MLELVIGNRNYSSWSLRPWLAMKMRRIEFTERRIPLSVPGTAAAIHAVSGAGRVPVLIDGPRLVWESLAILDYLAERDPALWPADLDARAHARSAAAEMHASFGALRAEMPMNVRATGRSVRPSEAAARDIARIVRLWNEARSNFGGGGPWLYGTFSVADAMFAPVASRFRTYGILPDATAKAYVETVHAAAPMKEWMKGAIAESEVIEEEEVGL